MSPILLVVIVAKKKQTKNKNKNRKAPRNHPWKSAGTSEDSVIRRNLLIGEFKVPVPAQLQFKILNWTLSLRALSLHALSATFQYLIPFKLMFRTHTSLFLYSE